MGSEYAELGELEVFGCKTKKLGIQNAGVKTPILTRYGTGVIGWTVVFTELKKIACERNEFVIDEINFRVEV